MQGALEILMSQIFLYSFGLAGWKADFRVTGVPHVQENAPPQDPTVGLCLGSLGGSQGGGRFLMGEVPLYRGTSLMKCGDFENACLFLKKIRNFSKNGCLFL